MIVRQGSRRTWLRAFAALFALLVGMGVLAVSTRAGALFGRGSGVPISNGHGVSVAGSERGDSCPAAYTISEATGAQIVAGTSLVPGSRCDDCQADVALPFTYTLYGTPY